MTRLLKNYLKKLYVLVRERKEVDSKIVPNQGTSEDTENEWNPKTNALFIVFEIGP